MKPIRLTAPGALSILTILVLGAVGCGVALFLAVARVQMTFDVTASTEIVETTLAGTAGAPSPFRWVLDEVNVIEGLDGVKSQRFSGTFEPVGGDIIVVERLGHGPVTVRVQSPAAHITSGRLYETNEAASRETNQFVEFVFDSMQERIENGLTVLLSLAGRIELGREVGFESPGGTAILRSATVRILAPPLVGEALEAGSIDLQPGDHFAVADGDRRCVEGGAATTFGLVTINDQPALTTRYRVVGCEGVVTRPGGGRFVVSPRLLSRLIREPAFLATSLVFSVIVGLVGLWSDLFPRPAAVDQPPSPSSIDVKGPAATAVASPIAEVRPPKRMRRPRRRQPQKGSPGTE